MKNNTHNKINTVYLKTHSNQSGFSLIEVMVAALILSIGVLGVVSLQIIGLKGTQQSYMKQQAMSIVQNLTERMRSNKEGVMNGHYVLKKSKNLNCGVTKFSDCSAKTSNCSSEDIANIDLQNLVCGYKTTGGLRTGGIRNQFAEDVSSLIDGKLTVACAANDCSTGNLNIEVNWTERELHRSINAPATEESLIINTRFSP